MLSPTPTLLDCSSSSHGSRVDRKLYDAWTRKDAAIAFLYVLISLISHRAASGLLSQSNFDAAWFLLPSAATFATFCISVIPLLIKRYGRSVHPESIDWFGVVDWASLRIGLTSVHALLAALVLTLYYASTTSGLLSLPTTLTFASNVFSTPLVLLILPLAHLPAANHSDTLLVLGITATFAFVLQTAAEPVSAGAVAAMGSTSYAVLLIVVKVWSRTSSAPPGSMLASVSLVRPAMTSFLREKSEAVGLDVFDLQHGPRCDLLWISSSG